MGLIELVNKRGAANAIVPFADSDAVRPALPRFAGERLRKGVICCPQFMSTGVQSVCVFSISCEILYYTYRFYSLLY